MPGPNKICTKLQLQEYHKELKQREEKERKDKIALWTLAVAGVIGVLILMFNGMRHDQTSDNRRIVIDPQTSQSVSTYNSDIE